MVILDWKEACNRSKTARNELPIEFPFDLCQQKKFSSSKTWIFLIFSKKIKIRGYRLNFGSQAQKFSYLLIAERSRAQILHKGSTHEYYFSVKFQYEISSHCKDTAFFVFPDQNILPRSYSPIYLKKSEIFMFVSYKILSVDINRKEIRRRIHFWHFQSDCTLVLLPKW